MTVEIFIKNSHGSRRFPFALDKAIARTIESEEKSTHYAGINHEYYDEDSWLWRRDTY